MVAAKGEPGVGRVAAAIAGEAYVVLRAVHTVVGFYIAVVAIVISLTVLIYTYVWGVGFRYAAQKTEAYGLIMKPRVSKSAPEAKELSIDRIVQIEQQKMPGNTYAFRPHEFPKGRTWYMRTMNAAPGSTRYCSSTAPRARS